MQDSQTRRDWLAGTATSLGSITSAIAGLGLLDLQSAAGLSHRASSPIAPHHRPRASRVLQIFCPGAASHMDLWEHKPELIRRHGQPLPGGENESSFQGKNGNLMRSPWDFAPAGQSGKMISTLLPHLAGHVDDIAFLHAMGSKTNTHGPGCVFANTGHDTEGFPAAGAWASYALGSENDNLPAYVAIADVRGEPPNGKANWASGFLPARYQGIQMSDQSPIRNLRRPAAVPVDADAAAHDLVAALNQTYADRHPQHDELRARVAAYELAARMQTAAPEVADLSKETAATHRDYGTGDANPLVAGYARNCLLARRLLASGVRYVNLYCGSRASGVDGLLNWDAHKTLRSDYERHAAIFDRPTAALLSDLKRTGLIDDTLVLWVTEFGRMPTHQAGTEGRDHNPDGFTMWMTGAGVRGTSYGATDDFGRRAEQNPTTVWDFYATVLDILGYDHERLTWYHNGLDRRLTDVHGRVVREVLA